VRIAINRFVVEVVEGCGETVMRIAGSHVTGSMWWTWV